jgi:hypothetical protein
MIWLSIRADGVPDLEAVGVPDDLRVASDAAVVGARTPGITVRPRGDTFAKDDWTLGTSPTGSRAQAVPGPR